MSKDAASLRDTFRVRAFVTSRGFGNGACGWGRLKTPTLSGGTAYGCLTLSPPQSSRDLTEWSRSVRSVFRVHENSLGLVSTNALPSRGMGFRRNLRLVHYGACGVPSPFIPLKGNEISKDLMETVNLLLRRNEGIFCCSCCTPCDADRPPRMRQWMTKRTVANAGADGLWVLNPHPHPFWPPPPPRIWSGLKGAGASRGFLPPKRQTLWHVPSRPICVAPLVLLQVGVDAMPHLWVRQCAGQHWSQCRQLLRLF